MVICVKIKEKDAEETRKILSERGLINENYNISSEGGHVYIPVSRDVKGYTVEEFDVPRRSNHKSVEEILGYKPTYEWVGDIVILKEDGDIDEIVKGFENSNQNPNAIVNKQTKVKGQSRVPEYELVKGQNAETLYKEYGYTYKIDLMSMYFTPRLATERKRFMDSLDAKDNTFDMFAGVGPYAIPAADVGSKAVATDINQNAVECLRHNADLNGVYDDVKAINCDVRDVVDEYTGWADNVVMNLPHSADEFIGQAENLISKSGTIYYYDFISDSKTKGELVEDVSSNLSSVDRITDYDFRRVRPYAPNVHNVCLEIVL